MNKRLLKKKGSVAIAELSNNSKTITINDIAKELGLSTATISRAISGKGRISKETRSMVLQYIEERDYRPNLIAKSLAQSKTYNICVVLPSDSNLIEIPFFQSCLIGICEVVADMDYDVVVTTTTENDISLLNRIIRNNKVDGVILTRALVDDLPLELLKKSNIPFVVIGSVVIGSKEDDSIYQVDNDHETACSELTSYLLSSDNKTIALVGGNQNHIVNQKRYQGFLNVYKEQNIQYDSDLIFMNLVNHTQIDSVVDKILEREVDCIICTDDQICSRVLKKLDEKNIQIPNDIRIASFYNSAFLENHNPMISAINIDVKELGNIAGNKLISLINGENVEQKTFVDYEIILRKSTI